MKTTGSVLTGTAPTSHLGLPLRPRTAGDDWVPPPTPPVRTADDYTLASSERRNRAKETNAIRARLRAAGKTWADARAWAQTQDRWTPADMPPGGMNLHIAAAYLATLEVTP